MKVLITGASGFVGSHLCERLLKDGHEVYALVRTPKKLTDLISTNDHLHLIKGDLDQEEMAWIKDLPADLDVCVHTAGIVHSYLPQEFFRVNTVATEQLINALKKRYGSHEVHFVLIS